MGSTKTLWVPLNVCLALKAKVQKNHHFVLIAKHVNWENQVQLVLETAQFPVNWEQAGTWTCLTDPPSVEHACLDDTLTY